MTKSEFIAALEAGGVIDFPKTDPIEARKIDADWITESSGKFHQIVIKNAVIVDPLRFDTLTVQATIHLVSCSLLEITAQYSIFGQWLRLNDCTIETRAIFHGAVFQRGLWIRSTKIGGKLNLSYATVGIDLDLGGLKCGQLYAAGLSVANNALCAEAEFAESCVLSFCRVGGQLEFRKARFLGRADIVNASVGEFSCVEAEFGGDARLERIKSTSSAFLANATFNGKTTLLGCDIEGQLVFEGAHFIGEAHFECRASSDFFARNAVFGSLVSFTASEFLSIDLSGSDFQGEARFLDMKVDRGMTISGCKFGGDVHFDRSSIGATLTALGTEPGSLIFGGCLSVAGARIGGQLNIALAVISGILSLESIDVEADVSIEQTLARAECKFNGMQVGGNFDLHGSQFESACNLKSSEIKGDAIFNSCNFRKRLSLDQSTFVHDVDFQGATVTELYTDGANVGGRFIAMRLHIPEVWSARDSKIHHLILDHADVNQPTSTFDFGTARLDFRGLRYELLDVPWRPFAKALSIRHDFDRQPFVEMEAHFRRIGREDIADNVYIMGMNEASKRWPWYSARRIFNFLLDIIGGYGARPERALIWAAGLVIVALVLFMVPGSSRPSDAPVGSNCDCSQSPDFQDKLALAVVSFIPGAHSVDGWTVAECRMWPFGIKAYILLGIIQLFGAIVYPIVLATITGLLHFVGERTAK